MRKAFNFGACATRSDTDHRSVSSEVPCQRSRLMQLAVTVEAELRARPGLGHAQSLCPVAASFRAALR